MPRFAALDLGSNALRLRIVEAHSATANREQLSLLPDGSTSSFREVTSLRAPVRLGSEVFLTGKLAMSSIGQACDALREFRDAMDTAKVDAYRATATSQPVSCCVARIARRSNRQRPFWATGSQPPRFLCSC